jgi:hypothetical protein
MDKTAVERIRALLADSKPNPAQPYIDDLLKLRQRSTQKAMTFPDPYVGPYLQDLFGGNSERS